MQNPLPFDLINDKATIYDIPADIQQNFKGVVITDQHFGKFKRFESSFPLFKSKLDYLLKATDPTCLIMLGDTVDYTLKKYKEAFKKIYDYLETLNIPVFLLGGNHDKERILNLGYSYDNQLIFVNDTFIRIQHPNPKDEKYSGILMGHDLGNNFLVDPPDAPIYVKWMRDVFDSYFLPGEMMLLGHTHQNISFDDKDSYSMKQFSPDFGSYQYALIEDDGNRYKVTFSELN